MCYRYTVKKNSNGTAMLLGNEAKEKWKKMKTKDFQLWKPERWAVTLTYQCSNPTEDDSAFQVLGMPLSLTLGACGTGHDLSSHLQISSVVITAIIFRCREYHWSSAEMTRRQDMNRCKEKHSKYWLSAASRAGSQQVSSVILFSLPFNLDACDCPWPVRCTRQRSVLLFIRHCHSSPVSSILAWDHTGLSDLITDQMRN